MARLKHAAISYIYVVILIYNIYVGFVFFNILYNRKLGKEMFLVNALLCYIFLLLLFKMYK